MRYVMKSTRCMIAMKLKLHTKTDQKQTQFDDAGAIPVLSSDYRHDKIKMYELPKLCLQCPVQSTQVHGTERNKERSG
jgi:hypothetical protein